LSHNILGSLNENHGDLVFSVPPSIEAQLIIVAVFCKQQKKESQTRQQIFNYVKVKQFWVSGISKGEKRINTGFLPVRSINSLIQ